MNSTTGECLEFFVTLLTQPKLGPRGVNPFARADTATMRAGRR
jgi:hypothetical protein